MRKTTHTLLAVILVVVMACGIFGGQVSYADEVQPGTEVQPEGGEVQPEGDEVQPEAEVQQGTEVLMETETQTEPEPEQPKVTGRWKKTKNYYYYYRNGKKLTGIKKIGKRKYYFSKKGVQRTGWRKVKGNYYFFRNVNGKGGYMVKGKKVNGIVLRRTGKAFVKKARSKEKVELMVKCAKMMDTVTKPRQARKTKLKIAFQYAKTHFPRRNIHDWRNTADWDIYYASYIINHRGGDCFCQGAFFAYLANAVGYTNVKAVSSGGHGWAMVNGEIYDPNWSFIIGDAKCYAVPTSLSGTGGRPNWAGAGIYKKDLRK